MKRLRFLPALLLILGACSENIIEQGNVAPGEMGSVSIALKADMSTEEVVTKADGDLPNVDDFWLSIYKTENQMRLYSDQYVNTKGREIKLNAGEYRLVAQHGDSLGCGFDMPYYMADPTFTVAGRNTEVNAVAKLANVKMAVVYSDILKEEYSDYYVIVKHQKYTSKKLTFSKTETRSGYMPGGAVVIQVYAIVDGAWKYFQSDPYTYNPNDFVTFAITTDTSKGNLVINIKVDSTVEDKNETVTLPAIVAPQEAPVITLAGFNSDNVHEFVEGVSEGANATASFIARGSLSHCYLTIESEYLSSKGVPSQLDFTNLTSEQKAILKSVGFEWDENMATSRKLSFINFSGVIAKMLAKTAAAAEDVEMAKFTLKVEDSVAKVTESTFSIVSASVKSTLTIDEMDVWARKVVGPTYSINRGNMSLLKLQTSTDKLVWTDVNGSPEQNGYTYKYEKVALNPATKYYLRAVYNNNPATASEVVTITTEAAAQLGNSGFEDYQLVQTTVKPLGSSYTRNWYLPYASGEKDPWWACNSRKTMPDGHTMLTSTWCKNFPSSGYVKNAHGGSKAAMLYCVNVSSGNTDGTAVGTTTNGEIWIGTADDSGNKATQGHAFASRPSKLAFWYKYKPTNGKKFYVETWIKDAAGNVIASSKETAGAAADNWTRYELPFTYSNLKAKAATIYVWIASANGTGSVDTGVTFELGEENVKAHAGCFLTIDDMELIYE